LPLCSVRVHQHVFVRTKTVIVPISSHAHRVAALLNVVALVRAHVRPDSEEVRVAGNAALSASQEGVHAIVVGTRLNRIEGKKRGDVGRSSPVKERRWEIVMS